MAWTITNNLNSIRFTEGAISYDIQKNDITLKEDGSCVFVFVDNQQLRGFTKLTIDPSEVDSPSVTNSTILLDTLNSYLNDTTPIDTTSISMEITLNDLLEEQKLTNKLLR